MQFVLHVRNHRIEVQRDDSLTDMFNMRIIPHYRVEQGAFLSTRILIVYLKKNEMLRTCKIGCDNEIYTNSFRYPDEVVLFTL